MSIATLTKREAVNIVLHAKLLQPINEDGEMDRNPEARKIVQALELKVKESLQQGYAFNTIPNVTTPLDGDGKAVLPVNVIRLATDQRRNPRFSIVGRKLWDNLNGTDVLTQSPRLSLVISLEWDELPLSFTLMVARNVALDEAARMTDLPRAHLQRVQEQANGALATFENEEALRG